MTVLEERKPSPELFEMIQAAASSLTGFVQLWDSIRKKGNSEGFTDQQLQDFIKPLLKAQLNMSKDQIWYMFNKEQKAIANKEAYEKTRINPKNLPKKDPEQNYEKVIKEKDETIKEKEKEIEEKDSKISQLEEAFHQITEKQFVPATELEKVETKQEPIKEFNVDEVFEQLPDDAAMTCWKIESIAGNALKNRISAWQGNSTKFFRVWMQEVNA